MMHEIDPAEGAEGDNAYRGTQAAEISDGEDNDEFSESEDTPDLPSTSRCPDTSKGCGVQPSVDPNTLSLDHLLSIAAGIASGNVGEQVAAVNDSVSLFFKVQSQVPSITAKSSLFCGGKHTFDDMEDTSQTSVYSSMAPSLKQPPTRVATTMSSKSRRSSTCPSSASSFPVSKRSRATSKFFQVAAMMSVVGAVNRMGDLIGQALKDPAIKQADVTAPLPPPGRGGTDYQVMAYQNLMKDTDLPIPVRSFMGLLIFDKGQESIHTMYATISDSALRCNIAQLLYNQHGSTSPTTASFDSFAIAPSGPSSSALGA